MSRDSKVVPGRKEYWCGTCERWGSHDLNHHDAWKQRTKEYFNKKKTSKEGNDSPKQPTGSANCAAGNSTSGTGTNHDDTSTVVSATPSTVVTGISNLSIVERLQRGNA
jgi:hypothetical protein